ncbi:ankyrin repeat-containing domain protein [Aspergillus crustosus]
MPSHKVLILQPRSQHSYKQTGVCIPSSMLSSTPGPKGSGPSPLIWAASHGRMETLLRAQSFGLDIYSPKVIYHAAEHGHVSILELLLSNKEAKVDLDYHVPSAASTAVSIASRNGHYATVELLLDHGADLNIPQSRAYKPLHHALINYHPDVAELLVMRGANVSATTRVGETPLHIACEVGSVKMAATLLDHGADISVMCDLSYTPLHMSVASASASAKLVTLLLERGADPTATDQQRYTPLDTAIVRGEFEICKLLMQHIADTSTDSQEWATPLTLAIYHDRPDFVCLFLNEGARLVPAESDRGENLFQAVVLTSQFGAIGVLKVLLEMGADVSAQHQSENTPLWWASYHGHLGVMKMLLDKDPFIVNARGSDGETALHAAANWRSADGVRLLLEYGADMSLKNDAGKTPSEVASENGCADTVELLAAYNTADELLHY